MARLLPLRNGPRAYRMDVELDGVTYTLALRLNARDGLWRLDLSASGETLLAGLTLVNSPDLLAQFRHIPGLPPGPLQVLDRKGRFADPDVATIGGRVVLIYGDAA